MRRREFITGILAAAASGRGSAAMASRGPGLTPLPPRARAEFWLGTQSIALNYLMVLNPDRTIGLDLRKAVPQFGDIAVQPVSDRPHQPLRRQLDDAVEVGEVRYFRRTLFVLPAEGALRPGHASIIHLDRRFEPQPPMQNVALSNRPTPESLRQEPRVGTAWQVPGRLFLLLPPTPLDATVSAAR
jgi:hypothetical protein